METSRAHSAPFLSAGLEPAASAEVQEAVGAGGARFHPLSYLERARLETRTANQ